MSSFSFRLEKSSVADSIFLKKKMIEFTDIKKVYGFLKANMGISYAGNPKYKNNVAYGVNTEQEQIQNYKKLYNKKLEAFQIGFILPKHKWGRIIPVNYTSLSVFHRPTRHSFCNDYYKDIDMVNAQPSIVNEICKLNNILSNKILQKYVDNPTKWRQFVMTHHNCTKDVAKQLFISLMFGGSYNSWMKENDIQFNRDVKIAEINTLEDEVKVVMEMVYASNQHIKEDVLRQDPKHWSSENDCKRGVMALWSQTVERLAQEKTIKFLVDEKGFQLEKIVPCQDGFMILKNLYYDGILSDVENVIKSTFNIDIKFIEKPFDEAIKIDTYDEDKNYNEWEDALSVKKIADKFIEKFGSYIVKYKSNIYVYWVSEINGGRWYDETDKNKQHKLTLYISEMMYALLKKDINCDVEIQEDEKIKLLRLLRNNTSSSSKINDIIKHILSNAQETEIDFNSNPFLLGFDNGVYDLQNELFRPYKFDDYITITTGYNYEPLDVYKNKNLIEELDNIIETIQPDAENRLLYLQILASGLDGRAYQKLFLLNGQGGNGKGLTGSLMDSILGGYYHQPSNGILKDVEKSNSPSPDMFNLKNKRYINFKEVAGMIRVAMLRNLTGGGKFCGRLLNQNPEHFFMSGTFVMEFNNPPELDGKPQRADYRRLVDLFFPVNFTDDPTKVNRTIAGVQFKQSNPYYETQEFIQKMRPVFLNKLLSIYSQHKDGLNGIKFTVPDAVRKRTEEFIENQNLFQKVFNDLWKKSDNLDDKEKIKDVWDSIVGSQEHKNLTHREKRQYGRDEFYKWIETMGYIIENNSKSGKVIRGIKPLYNDEELEVIQEVEEINNIIIDELKENKAKKFHPLDF
jgi:phage/plasmid-associated DNA primase